VLSYQKSQKCENDGAIFICINAIYDLTKLKKMPRTRRTLRQIHPNLSRQFPNNLEFFRAVNNFNAENLRRRNPSQLNRRRYGPYFEQRQRPPVEIPVQLIDDFQPADQLPVTGISTNFVHTQPILQSISDVARRYPCVTLKRHKKAKIVATAYAHSLLGEIKWRPICRDPKLVENYKFLSTLLDFERNGGNFEDQVNFRNAIDNNSENPDEFPELFVSHTTFVDDPRYKKNPIFLLEVQQKYKLVYRKHISAVIENLTSMSNFHKKNFLKFIYPTNDLGFIEYVEDPNILISETSKHSLNLIIEEIKQMFENRIICVTHCRGFSSAESAFDHVRKCHPTFVDQEIMAQNLDARYREGVFDGQQVLAPMIRSLEQEITFCRNNHQNF
jgi:hypothetical protein